LLILNINSFFITPETALDESARGLKEKEIKKCTKAFLTFFPFSPLGFSDHSKQ
jgi:hypothetical protein